MFDNLTRRDRQIYTVEIALDGEVIARQEVPSRRALRYLLDHPRSKYTVALRKKLRAAGLTEDQLAFILSLEPEDMDEACDAVMDAEDRDDGSNYLDDPRYPTK